MIIFIVSILLIPFLFREPFIFEFISQRYFLCALLAALTVLRTYYSGWSKLKSFLISLFSGTIFILIIMNSTRLIGIFYPEGTKIHNMVRLKIASILILLLGLISIGFLIYNVFKLKSKGNKIYRFMEASTGILFLVYPFFGMKVYILIIPCIAASIFFNIVYFVLWSYVKIMEPVKLKKLARLREEILANYPDSPLR